MSREDRDKIKLNGEVRSGEKRKVGDKRGEETEGEAKGGEKFRV